MDKSNLLIVAPSLLDELGHFEYINEISKHLSEEFNVKVLCQEFANSSLEDKISKKFTIERKNFNIFRMGDSLETKIFINKIPLFKNAIHALVKVIYHIKIHIFVRNSSYKNIIYLETEPLSLLLIPKLLKNKKKLIITLHAVDFNTKHSGFKKIYKILLRHSIKRVSTRISCFAVHNKSAKRRLESLGIEASKVFISGWGINKNQKSISLHREDRIKCLAFGVIRQSKRINELVERFLKEDDERIELKIVGKNIDCNMQEISHKINESNSRTKIIIDDRFIHREEFEAIFSDCDLFVLSHDKSFQSISGPLFNAVESLKPILCFSFEDTKEMVKDYNLGVCADLDSTEKSVYLLCKEATNKYTPESMDFFLWENVSSRIQEEILRA